ncbi:hypothetical protein E1N52_36715 [Paraburkholderia guartelaensis]|uniref:Uncharacterized protein n=1 Tax=Paraburkholderia guartelaensis TaxID=2546446 RepID=A0A4R5L5Q6_9BURK|nr:hypothetical protein E1N52_36715 [Paraburkholderia guartelaensis]
MRGSGCAAAEGGPRRTACAARRRAWREPAARTADGLRARGRAAALVVLWDSSYGATIARRATRGCPVAASRIGPRSCAAARNARQRAARLHNMVLW